MSKMKKGKTIFLIMALLVFSLGVISCGKKEVVKEASTTENSKSTESTVQEDSTEEMPETTENNTTEMTKEDTTPQTDEEANTQMTEVIPESSIQGHTIVIDPGHQLHGSSEQEPIGPGSEETKARVTSGTQGISTGNTEFQLNLTVSLMLKEELESRGYTVIMTRETNEVDLSNIDRANIANESNADIFVRIHANSDNDSSINGVLTMAPTESNPYVSSLYEESSKLSELLVDHIASTTGANNRGVMYTDDMSGINWSQIPVSIVEMGFMSNPEEDGLLGDSSYQGEIVTGIADGIDEYFQ